MQITVNMIFESSGEFENWAHTIGLTSPAGRAAAGAPTGVPDSPETEQEAEKAPSKPRRTRRTKKQIEEDAAKAASAHADKLQQDVGNPPAEAVEPPVVTGSEPATGLEPVPENNVAIMRAFIAKQGSASLIAKLKEYGVKRIHEVAPERMTEFLTELVAGS